MSERHERISVQLHINTSYSIITGHRLKLLIIFQCCLINSPSELGSVAGIPEKSEQSHFLAFISMLHEMLF